MEQSYIYLITNLINNKTYVGQHCGRHKSYFGSGQLIKKAVKKYGKENFDKKILIKGNFSKEMLNELEIHYTQLYSSCGTKNSYNLTKGGEGQLGWIPTEETRKNMSIAAKKRYKDNPEHSERLKEINKGKKRSQEWIDKMRLINKGNKYCLGKKQSKEAIEKRILSTKGRGYSEECKKRMSEGRIGMKFADKHKQSLSKSRQLYFERIKKPILQFDLNNNLIKEWNVTTTELCKALNIKKRTFLTNLQGKSKKCNGYIFKFKKEK